MMCSSLTSQTVASSISAAKEESCPSLSVLEERCGTKTQNIAIGREMSVVFLSLYLWMIYTFKVDDLIYNVVIE